MAKCVIRPAATRSAGPIDWAGVTGRGASGVRPVRPVGSTRADRPRPRRRKIGVGGWLLRAAWALLAMVVLVVAAALVWQLVGTNQVSGKLARQAIDDYFANCAAQRPTAGRPADGTVQGVLSFPGRGAQSWPVVAGIGPEQLATGVGWYSQTARVGEIGNMVLAGYRVTNGQPFANLLELQAGDRIQIVTCDRVHLYQIDVAPANVTVQSSDVWVLDAVPGKPGRQPTGRMITVITNQDLLPTPDRSVGFGHLVASEPR